MVYLRCFMCKNNCGIIAENINGKIIVKPNPNHPQPGICIRGTTGPQILDHPDRLKYPLKNVNGEFVKISWDEALDEITKRLKELLDEGHPEYLAITFHDYGKELLERFASLFGTPNLIGHEDTCHGPRSTAAKIVLGAGGPRTLEPDYVNTKFLVLIGRNPSEGIIPEIMKKIDIGVKNGMNIVVIDPRKNLTAKKYNAKWIPIRPGTDLAFLLSLIYYMIKNKMYDEEFLKKYSNAGLLIYEDDLSPTNTYSDDLLYEGEMNGRKVATAFYLLMKEGEKVYNRFEEITGVSYDDLKYVAENLWKYRPQSVIDDAWHTSFSIDSTYTWMSVFIINAMLGNLDKKGGLIFTKRVKIKLYKERKYNVERVDKIKYPLTVSAFHEVYNAILTEKPYPIKVLMVVGTNLIGRDPNTEFVKKALEKLDFIFTIDIFPTEITLYSDIVLPESTYLERDDIPLPAGWSLEPYIDIHQKLVDPLYDTKPLWWILFELERRLGLANDDFEKIKEEIFKQLNIDENKKKELYEKGCIKIETELYEVYPYKKPLDTPSGKVEIYSTLLYKYGYYPLPKYIEKEKPKDIDEFYFVSGHTLYHTQDSITFDIPTLINLAPENYLFINKNRAEKLGLKDNDNVEVYSLTTKEKVIAKVKLTDEIREDTVFAYFGYGHESKYLRYAYGKGFNVNKLISNELVDPISGGIAQSINIVKIKKVERS